MKGLLEKLFKGKQIELTRDEFIEALNQKTEDEFNRGETDYDNNITLLLQENMMNKFYPLKYFQLNKKDKKEYYFEVNIE